MKKIIIRGILSAPIQYGISCHGGVSADPLLRIRNDRAALAGMVPSMDGNLKRKKEREVENDRVAG
jgi:hypothetical protein